MSLCDESSDPTVRSLRPLMSKQVINKASSLVIQYSSLTTIWRRISSLIYVLYLPFFSCVNNSRTSWTWSVSKSVGNNLQYYHYDIILKILITSLWSMCLHGQALKNQSFATIGHSDLVSIHRQRGGSNIGRHLK